MSLAFFLHSDRPIVRTAFVPPTRPRYMHLGFMAVRLDDSVPLYAIAPQNGANNVGEPVRTVQHVSQLRGAHGYCEAHLATPLRLGGFGKNTSQLLKMSQCLFDSFEGERYRLGLSLLQGQNRSFKSLADSSPRAFKTDFPSGQSAHWPRIPYVSMLEYRNTYPLITDRDICHPVVRPSLCPFHTLNLLRLAGLGESVANVFACGVILYRRLQQLRNVLSRCVSYYLYPLFERGANSPQDMSGLIFPWHNPHCRGVSRAMQLSQHFLSSDLTKCIYECIMLLLIRKYRHTLERKVA